MNTGPGLVYERVKTVNVLKLNWTGTFCKVSGKWISVFFDKLCTNNRGVTSLIDLL